MDAIVAMSVGLVAVAVVGLLTVLSTIAIAGLKVVSAVHAGGTWVADHLHRRWTR